MIPWSQARAVIWPSGRASSSSARTFRPKRLYDILAVPSAVFGLVWSRLVSVFANDASDWRGPMRSWPLPASNRAAIQPRCAGQQNHRRVLTNVDVR